MTILVAVDVLFAVFVVLQLAYLFGGLDTLAATGLPTPIRAERLLRARRRGGALPAACVADRPRGRRPAHARPSSGAGLALAGLTAVVLASALLRLADLPGRVRLDRAALLRPRHDRAGSAIGIAITAIAPARPRPDGAGSLHGAGDRRDRRARRHQRRRAPRGSSPNENVARLLDPSLGSRPTAGPDSTSTTRASSATTRCPRSSPPCRRSDPADRASLLTDARGSVARRCMQPDATGWPALEPRPPGRDARGARPLPGGRSGAQPVRRPALHSGGAPAVRSAARADARQGQPTACPSGDGWLFEPKWDGFRAIVFRDGDEVLIQSRDLKPLDRYFPELAGAAPGELSRALRRRRRGRHLDRRRARRSRRSCSGSIRPRRG